MNDVIKICLQCKYSSIGDELFPTPHACPELGDLTCAHTANEYIPQSTLTALQAKLDIAIKALKNIQHQGYHPQANSKEAIAMNALGEIEAINASLGKEME